MEYFTFSNVLFTAAGAIVFWARKGGRSELKAFGLTDVVTLLPGNRRILHFLEFVVFVGLGCIVGIGCTGPSNPRQALTAGFGWTSLLATTRSSKGLK